MPDAPATPEPFAPLHGTGRSLGLDVFRGLVIAWLVVLVHTPTMGWRGHAAWWGFDHSDVFFPAFLFVAGAGLAHQVKDRPMPWPRLLRRLLTLIVLGLFVNAWLADGAALESLRLPGVLQRIAVVGIVGAIVVEALRRRWAAVLAAGVLVMVAWSGILAVSASDCPDGRPTATGCGTLIEVDEAVFGSAHLYHEGTRGHDPEGLPSTTGALATFLVGFAAARSTHHRRHDHPRRRVVPMLGMAAGLLVLSPLLLLAQPLNKRLWTGSFAAVTGAGCLLLLAGLIVVLDGRTGGRARAAAGATWPIVALGRNALVLWTGVFLLQGVLARTRVGHAQESLGPWFLETHGAGWYFLAFGGSWFVIGAAMHAARWHVRL